MNEEQRELARMLIPVLRRQKLSADQKLRAIQALCTKNDRGSLPGYNDWYDLATTDTSAKWANVLEAALATPPTPPHLMQLAQKVVDAQAAHDLAKAKTREAKLALQSASDVLFNAERDLKDATTANAILDE